MKRNIIIVVAASLLSCQSIPSYQNQHPKDSFEIENSTPEKVRYLDSLNALSGIPLTQKTLAEYETLGKSSPVIATGKIVNGDLGRLEIHLYLKNSSKKTVNGVKIGYSLYNNFGENVSGIRNYTWAESQEIVPAKSTKAVRISIDNDATKINHVFVSEVHFTDGSKWAAPN